MRDYSLLFGLAVLGLIVGGQQPPAPKRPAALPLAPAANGKVTPEQLPGPAPK